MAYWDDYFSTLLSNLCNAFEQRKNGTINFSVTTWFRAVIKLISLPMLIQRVVINSSAFIFRYWALSVCHRLRVQQCHTLFWMSLHFTSYTTLNNNKTYEDYLWMWKNDLHALYGKYKKESNTVGPKTLIDTWSQFLSKSHRCLE